jgi:translation initiation factor IF-1
MRATALRGRPRPEPAHEDKERRTQQGRYRRTRTAQEGNVIADKEEKIVFEGEVVEAFRSGMYRVTLDNGHEALAYTAGKMRRHRIRIMLGDRIKLELSPYDLTRGRIVYRHRALER